ncbi:MAG: EVE domain-containing protein [Mariprofundaceae bacterium]
MQRRFWLMKTEPGEFSIDDLAACAGMTEPWDGVRNYQARNFMRDDMRIGDGILIYHSRVEPMAVVGMAEVASTSYPDATAWDVDGKHFDAKSTPERPRWFLVDVRFKARFQHPVTLKAIKKTLALEHMMLVQKGSRLSIQPVRPEEWNTIVNMGMASG